jgi:hypothetical protein
MSSRFNAPRVAHLSAALVSILFAGFVVACNGEVDTEGEGETASGTKYSVESVGETADALKSVVIPHVHAKLPWGTGALGCGIVEGSTTARDPATGCYVTTTISNCTQTGNDCDCTETISSSNCNIVLTP